MSQRRWARRCAVVLALVSSEAARSGVWATEPVFGLVAEYSSNPALLYVEHSAETHEAVLLDVPTTYHADNVSFSIHPSVRISNSPGYSSLASDCEHLSFSGEIDSERNSLVLTGQIARDSSLYYNFELNGSTGVRRDTTMADLTWQRGLTELLNFNLDLNSSRVIYGPSAGFTTLTDYHYTLATPSLIWKTSERTSLTLSGSEGLYNSSDGSTKSANSNLQVGFTRALTELWSATGSVGYSRESNKIGQDVLEGFEVEDGFLIPVYAFETFKSTESGSIFAANVTRQRERLKLTAGASRTVAPSGFAFLSRQTTYQLGADYQYSERWTLDAQLRRQTTTLPQAFAPTLDQSYWDLELSAAWQMTERWKLTLGASRLNSNYTPPRAYVDASGFSIQISYNFNRIEWH